MFLRFYLTTLLLGKALMQGLLTDRYFSGYSHPYSFLYVAFMWFNVDEWLSGVIPITNR